MGDLDDIESAEFAISQLVDRQDSKDEMKMVIDEELGVLAKHECVSPTFII